MTATTNGASLEDCLTNIFSLIDLNGIRWKKFKHKENNSNYLYTPIDTHPILTTYAKCIEENHIAVWRHEPQKRHSATGAGGGGIGGNNPAGHTGSTSSNFPTPTRASNNNTPTGAGPTNLNSSGNLSNSNNNASNNAHSQNNYELWIFGYANQLKVDNVIGDDLVEIEDDTWESRGLSYECRTLLFKALHNLVERCLINKGFTRIGRWFVQPSLDNIQQTSTSSACSQNLISVANKPSKHLKLEQNSIIPPSARAANLSSTISQTLNRIIESRREEFETRQCLDKSDGLRHTSDRSCNSYFTSSLDGSKLSLSFSFSFFVHGDSTVCATVDVRQHPLVHPLTRNDLNILQDGGILRVALAPFGLNGILNGINYKDSDNGAATAAFIQQWSKFYPLPKTLARLVPAKSQTHSAMNNFNPKTPTNSANQFGSQTSDNQGSRSYLSNLTNMLLPPTNKPNLYCNYEPNEVPPIVEVIVAGFRMRYPSECVFTTSRVVDLYKSLDFVSNQKSTSSPNIKKTSGKLGMSRPNKLSLLSEKLTEDRFDPNSKVKVESEHNNQSKPLQSNFNSPFRLGPSGDSTQQNAKSDESSINYNNNFMQQATGVDIARDKNTNGCNELDGSTNSNSSGTQTIPRFNLTKSGFGSNNAPLGPNDLVKLFPTPPSLEQVVLSPTAQVEESIAKKPALQIPANFNLHDPLRDNGIDVYKPVECALMPPPPKWAPLTNVVISSTKTLPPQCIYRKSPSNTKTTISKLVEPIKASSTKTNSTFRQFNSPLSKNLQQSILSPLTDQTNKNGFNNSSLGISSPKPITSHSLLGNSVPSATSNLNLIPSSSTSSTSIAHSTQSVSSSYTLPHQRLFNNLNEINSIQLNLVISDTVLGMFQDHNFENCTLCVCNMTIRGVQTDPLYQKNDTNNGNQWRTPTGNDNMINSPATHGEYANECTCGFSAITNRHCSHLSGLFLEDELELTNVLYDPTEMIDQNKLFRKIRLSNYNDASYCEEQKLMAKLHSDNRVSKTTDDGLRGTSMKQDRSSIKEDKSSSQNVLEETKMFVIDQLKQQCYTMIHSNSSLTKVLLVESFRNNRHLTSCTNYYAQTSVKSNTNSPLYRFFDDSNKYTSVKMFNRNPLSLRFSDFCELTKGLITKLGHQTTSNVGMSNSLAKPTSGASGLSSILLRMMNPARKPIDLHSNNRNNIFAQGLQALVMPTLSIDPKGALQMLEELIKDDSKEALATLNKAILIFSSPIHDWQFITAPIPENNLDVSNLLKILQPSLDESIGSHNKKYKDFVHQQQQHIFSARDSPTGAPVVPTPPCQGPLTWRQFHQSSGRGTEDQCEPQPIPTLLVGHHVEKNHLALSPFALRFWDKLSLEPYAPGHNMFYLVIAPENQNVLEHVNAFFKELSNTYELMKLGKHSPISDGIVSANNNIENFNSDDSWYSELGFGEKDFSSGVINRLKSYAAKMGSSLAKTIAEFMDERQPPFDPHSEKFDASPTPHENKSINSLTNKCVTNQQTTTNRNFNHIFGIEANASAQTHDSYGHPSDVQGYTNDGAKTLLGSSAHGNVDDNIFLEDEANKQSGIVIYIIDPFSSPSVSQNLRTLSTIGLIRCYSKLLEQLPENIRMVTQLQLISMDSIICSSRPIFNVARVDQLKSLSMNVYSRCRKIMANQITAKSLTGFGPAAALDSFFKTKNPEFSVARVYTPPYILAPTKDKQTELGEMFGDRREKSSVLFCSYCITEDQRWLLVSITNERGEISETTVININVVDKLKRPKTSVKGVALKKMMEFIVSVMSDFTNPWRLIIGKLGRVGHGELKEWASLLSKRSLLHYSRILTERCRQCTILPATETVSILSACLVSLEPDSKLRIMPDQFTIDDRQASFNKCPLRTPEDASATHILVFPTSASIHAAQGNAEDPALTSGLDDDILQSSLLEDEDLCIEGGFNDLFGDVWTDNPTNVSDNINSHHDTMMSSSNLQMGSGAVGDGGNNQDEPLQLLQQPLALGYYMSTAKINHMPNWFWSTNPHLRNSCPVFLKSALHFHIPCVQLQDDYMHSERPRKSHQLDSNLTTDVLRYVLEGYNSLSWLALNPKTYDRQSCLPVHMQNLLQLYHLMESFS